MWNRLVTLSIDDREGMEGKGEGTTDKEANRGRGVVVHCGYEGRLEGKQLVCDCVLWHFPSKNKKGSEFRVSVCVHSVLGCTESCLVQ